MDEQPDTKGRENKDRNTTFISMAVKSETADPVLHTELRQQILSLLHMEIQPPAIHFKPLILFKGISRCINNDIFTVSVPTGIHF